MSANNQTDAELIASASRYFEAERLLAEKYGLQDIDKDDPLLDEISVSLKAIVNARASTLEGHRARARAIAFYTPDLTNTQTIQGEDEAMMAALLRDLVGEART